MLRQDWVVETATRTLHRLTSFETEWYDAVRLTDGEWSAPVDDPRVVRDFEPNDLDRLPWFVKRYAQSLPRVALPPRDFPRRCTPGFRTRRLPRS